MSSAIVKTLVTLIVVFTVLYVVRQGMERYFIFKRLDAERSQFIYKILKSVLIILTGLTLVSIWGLNPRHVWLFAGSLFGIVAIGFFAVWSILSNVIAGLFLFFSGVIKLNAKITIMPDDISGTVTDLKLLFVMLQDENGDIIHIPNNLMIQKIVKRAP